MRRVRVIAILLIKGEDVYKTVKFRSPSYIGDPINTLRLFNDLEVDEIIVLDIDASKQSKSPNIDLIENLGSECFMPLTYGGGIKTMDDIANVLFQGVEKVSINSASYDSLDLIKEASNKYGSSTIVASVDIKIGLFGTNKVYNYITQKSLSIDVLTYIKSIEESGAGEILLNFVDRDGTFKGYDEKLIKKLSKMVSIPIVIAGGARDLEDFYLAIKNGASAVAAGSMFVYYGKYNAVLVNYPTQEKLMENLFLRL
jgi:cyclase